MCLVCETKLHINTVTSDILRALAKAEYRVEARDRRIQQVSLDLASVDSRVAMERRRLNDHVAENKMKSEKLELKLSQ